MSLRDNYDTNGTYNNGRGVPPPRTGGTSSSFNTSITDNLTIPSNRFLKPAAGDKSALNNPFILRVIVMIDEATEPGITDAKASEYRQKITDLLTGRDTTTMPRKTTPVSSGDAVAFAIRKRLKSDDETAVLNTLVLLDEIMRTVPYFYRHVANDKFFRRLWRFVVPDYKNQMKSYIPLLGKPNIHLGMQGRNSVITQRVLILVRAWATELSNMFYGQYDSDAGFLIERYKNKRQRVPFPDLPKTSTPWVCPVNKNSSSSRRYNRRYNTNASNGGASSSSTNLNVEMMSLEEVENTVRLFSSLIDSATSEKDVKEEACNDLYERCKHIQNNITNLSMNMSKEEDLTRAVAISEILQRSLAKHDDIISNRNISSTNDPVSLESDDENYQDAYSEDSSSKLSRDLRKSSIRSANGPGEAGSSSNRRKYDFTKSLQSYANFEQLKDRRRFEHRNNSDDAATLDRSLSLRDKRTKTDDRSARDYGRISSNRNHRPRDDYEKEREKFKKSIKYIENDSEDQDSKKEDRISRSKSVPKKSSNNKKEQVKNKKKKPSKIKENLINVQYDEDEDEDGERNAASEDEDEDEDEDDSEANGESFNIIAERQAKLDAKSKKSSKIKINKEIGGSSSGDVKPSSNEDYANNASNSASAAGGMYASNTMGMNPMMLMPNPYAMYQSVGGPMGMGGMSMGGMGMGMNDPMSAYMSSQPSFNPALMYQSMNGGMMGPQMGMPGMGMGPGMGAPPPLPYQSSAGAIKGGDNMSQRQAVSPTPEGSAASTNREVAPGMSMVPASNEMNQAAIYQNAMQQAATAYHMAANAYRTVQGQAPIGQAPIDQSGGQSPAGPSTDVRGEQDGNAQQRQ